MRKSSNEILNRECDQLAIAYAETAQNFDKVKADLEALKAKKATKKQQWDEKRAQTSFNHFKRLRDEALAKLVVISEKIGRYDELFCDDPKKKNRKERQTKCRQNERS